VADRRDDPSRLTRSASPTPVPLRIPSDSRESTGRIVRFRSQDGLQLAARVFDAKGAERLPLLCLPGLSRNSRDFALLGRFFSQHADEPRKVVALDYRGRGLSDADPDWRNYTTSVEAQDVLAAAAVLGVERAIIVGTSRGGIIAMLLGALRPGLLAGVVLNDIGPVLEATGLARIKKYLSAKRTIKSWDDAVAVMRDIGGRQFPALAEEDWREVTEAYFVETQAGLAPQFDPNLIRIVENIDLTEKIPVLWPQFASLAAVPLLAVRGALSDILSPRTLAEMSERHPLMESLVVAGQGHPPTLADQATLERVFAFVQHRATFTTAE